MGIWWHLTEVESLAATTSITMRVWVGCGVGWWGEDIERARWERWGVERVADVALPDPPSPAQLYPMPPARPQRANEPVTLAVSDRSVTCGMPIEVKREKSVLCYGVLV